jgi:hypothetical protein
MKNNKRKIWLLNKINEYELFDNNYGLRRVALEKYNELCDELENDYIEEDGNYYTQADWRNKQINSILED